VLAEGLVNVTASLVVKVCEIVWVPLTETTTTTVSCSLVDTGGVVVITTTGVVVVPILDIVMTVEGGVVVEGAADELDTIVGVELGVVESVGEDDGVRVDDVDDPSLDDFGVVDGVVLLADAPVPRGTLVCTSVGSFLLGPMASVKESTASSESIR